MEELQKLSDEDKLTVEISNFNNDINEFHKDLIAREVELLNGLEVGGASLLFHRPTCKLLQSRNVFIHSYREIHFLEEECQIRPHQKTFLQVQ